MLKKILLATAVLLIIVGCHSHHGSHHHANGNDHRYGAEIIPGSQEDLVLRVGDRVQFRKDGSELSAEAQDTLKKQAMWLQAYPDVVVTVEGHCDERGTKVYNLALGERRAEAVKKFLVANGVDPSRVYTISFGKERPEFYGHNPTAWAKNRRAVTTIAD